MGSGIFPALKDLVFVRRQELLQPCLRLLAPAMLSPELQCDLPCRDLLQHPGQRLGELLCLVCDLGTQCHAEDN